MRIFVGCSSRDNIPSKYYDNCIILLDKLFSNNYDLVFGACNKGLMGLAYNAAISHNSDIIGIYPDAYKDEARELHGTMLSVNSVNDRTDKVIEQSDILLFLPGGIGTVYELFTAIESKRAGEHNKPIIIYNIDGFYNNLFLQLKEMCSENFVSLDDLNIYDILNEEDSLIKYIDRYRDNINKGLIKKRKSI